MVHAGADITANLILNTTGFTEGLTKTSTAVAKFKESMMDLGKDSATVKSGIDNASRAISQLLQEMSKFSGLEKQITKFKEFSLALEHLALAAQRLAIDTKEGGLGIQTLTSVMDVWRAGVESAEIKVTGLATAIRNMGSSSKSTASEVKSSFDEMIQGLNAWALDITRTGNVMTEQEAKMVYEAQWVREAYGSLSTSVNQVSATFQSWKSLTDSVVNSTTQNIVTSTEKVKTSLGNMSTGFENTTVTSNNVTSALTRVSGELNVTDGTIKKVTAGVKQYAEALSLPKQALYDLGTVVNPLKMTLIDLWNVYARGNTVINPTVSSLEMMNSALVQNRNSVMALITGQNEETVSLERNSIAMRENGAERLRAMGYTGKLTIEEEKETGAVNQNTSAHMRNGNAMTQASAKTNQLTSATNRLKSALSSLRMIGNLVGSMLAYNFAHKLLVATGETIHAKSEMEGYFKMLNFGQSDIDHFNQALDRTVSQFQRVNKYSLGETISSIGVEFNLTTQEMEKAMKVTSMITSEYLRAGRNANEASLAVKDVLQGQFQRLSRETGVKQKDLMSAGWSGDTTDVLGLMKALEKVAESRNWDVFAEKANSLNDILTILQNRFGEWSADMVYMVQPAIVGTFNAIMDVAGTLSQGLTGLWQWLTGDGWTQGAIKVLAFGGAIATLIASFIKLRTGASLVQISQMGLLKSITASILGLNAEAVATSGLTGAIAQSITGLTAEQVAQVGSTQAIYGKILGLDMEVVAEEGLVGAINSSIISREAESVATVEQTGANIGFLGALTSVITGEEIATGTTLSLAEALGVLTAEMLMNPITWFVGALMALAGAFYVATGGLSDHWEKMKQFNETMNQSDDIIQQNNDYLKELGETLGTDSQIYQDTASVVDAFNDKIKESKEVVEKYNDELSNLDVKLTTAFDKNLKNYGFDDSQLAKFREYGILDEGKSTYDRALDVIYLQESNAEKTQKDILDKMDKRDATDEEIADKSNQIKQHEANLIKHSAEHNTSDDWWGGTWAWFLSGLDSIQLWLDYATEDLATWISDFSKDWSKLPDQISEAWNNLNLPDLGKMWGDWVNDISKSLGDSGKSLKEMWENNISKPIGELGAWFMQLFADPLGALGITLPEVDLWGMLMDLIFPQSVSASDGSSDHPSILEDLKQGFGIDIQAFLDGLSNDPIGTLGLVIPAINIGSFISSLIPDDGGASIWNWVNNSIIQPMSSAITNGIASIPIISDIAQMLGLIPQANPDAQDKGSQIARSFQNALENIIASIPILSDILRILGIIPQANPTASSNGQGVGNAIKDGLRNGISGLADIVSTEIQNVINVVKNAVGQAYQSACDVGNAIVNGVKSAMNINSPGILSTEIVWREFAEHIPDAISDNAENAYNSAVGYGQRIVDGVSSVNFNSFDTMATDYQTDAQDISATTQMLGMDTTTAFNDMALAVNTVTGTMGTNVASTYTSMQTKQMSSLDTMKQKNTTAFNDMYTKSNQSLIQMRDSTSNITHQMTNAWSHMKDQIVATANQLKTESTNHFNQLSNTIGSFYRKIQNPSNWGAGSKTPSNVSARTSRNPSVGRSFARGISTRTNVHGAGGGSYTGSSTMSIAQLKKMLCPNGDCGNLFDGYSITDRVNVEDFLASITGEHGVGWTGWNRTHYNYIKDVSDKWDTGSPVINLVGGIPTSAKFKVGDFESGTPKISFSEFQSMAEAIFSRIPYKLYYDSSWKGSWLGALQAGACNCSDGADALIAFAQTCGFDGYKQHGYWGSTGHFWAVINGKVMDTTAWQGGYGWTSPKVHGYGSPDVRRAVHNPSMQTTENGITINIDMSDSTFYGENDLESRIEESIDRGLEKHFNKSYAVGI